MNHLVLCVDVKGSDVVPIEFFGIELSSVNLFVCAFFAQNFKQDGSVAVQDLIYFSSCFICNFIEFFVISGFTFSRTKYFVGSAIKHGGAHFAFFHSIGTLGR